MLFINQINGIGRCAYFFPSSKAIHIQHKISSDKNMCKREKDLRHFKNQSLKLE